MKRIAAWILVRTLILFLIDLGVMGLQLLNGNYDVLRAAYIAAACWIIMLVCAVVRLFSSRCPHCCKLKLSNGKYCPHCGKEI